MKRTALIVAAFAALLSGCAPMSQLPAIDKNLTAAERDKQMELAMRESARREARANAIAGRILFANADACGERVAHRFGLQIGLAADAPADYLATWRKVFGDHGFGYAAGIVPGGPADIAGIKQGDIVQAINNQPISGDDGKKTRNSILNGESSDPVVFQIRRGNEVKDIAATPAKACSYPVQIQISDAVNAFADGKRIVITNGMLRFATADEELALVIGHELAHNTENHITAKRGNRLVGALLGALISVAVRTDVSRVGADIGSMAFSQGFEAEADYVGTYYVAKAGFDIEKAADFWRRMAVEHPKAIGHGTTHPDTASRFVAIEAATKEVAEKRAAGMALVPEKKR